MKRAKHSLTHYKLLTMKMGNLVPVSWFEVLPGDTIQMNSNILLRAAPMVTPAMHPCHVRVHHFYVPNRIIWQGTQPIGAAGEDGWEAYITGGYDGNDALTHPYINVTNVNGSSGNNAGVSTLADYLGVPTANSTWNMALNALPFRAYAMIWNEFFRDQDLQSLLTVSQASGGDTTTSTTLQACDWEKDYLTSARPWVVKGPSVTLPLGTTAPIRGLGVDSSSVAATSHTYYDTDSTSTHTDPSWSSATGASVGVVVRAQSNNVPGAGNIPQVFADLSNATAVSINTLRHALAIQRFEEARARYGSRYTEYLRYLGVRSSDARLQRPELLSSGRSTLQISEVLQTGVTTSGSQTGVATMFGHGISAMRSNRFRRFFEEHGIVMTLLSVRPRTMYSQRLDRAWMRGNTGWVGQVGNKEDYWQRELQHIGQQALDGGEADARAQQTTFGYQDRYDEYRRCESQVAGLFRSTLDTWHLSREFGSTPSLNATFVSCVPSTRIFADTSNDNLYVMAHHSVQARRLVSKEGNSLTF